MDHNDDFFNLLDIPRTMMPYMQMDGSLQQSSFPQDANHQNMQGGGHPKASHNPFDFATLSNPSATVSPPPMPSQPPFHQGGDNKQISGNNPFDLANIMANPASHANLLMQPPPSSDQFPLQGFTAPSSNPNLLASPMHSVAANALAAATLAPFYQQAMLGNYMRAAATYQEEARRRSMGLPSSTASLPTSTQNTGLPQATTSSTQSLAPQMPLSMGFPQNIPSQQSIAFNPPRATPTQMNPPPSQNQFKSQTSPRGISGSQGGMGGQGQMGQGQMPAPNQMQQPLPPPFVKNQNQFSGGMQLGGQGQMGQSVSFQQSAQPPPQQQQQPPPQQQQQQQQGRGRGSGGPRPAPPQPQQHVFHQQAHPMGGSYEPPGARRFGPPPQKISKKEQESPLGSDDDEFGKKGKKGGAKGAKADPKSNSYIFNYYKGAQENRKYLSEILPLEDVEEIDDDIKILNEQLLEALLLMDYKDLVFVEELVEREVQYFDRFFEAFHVPCVVWRRGGHIIYVNDIFCEMLKCSRGDATKDNIIKFWPKEHAKEYMRNYFVKLQAPQNPSHIIGDMWLRRKWDNHPLCFRVHLSLRRNMYFMPSVVVAVLHPFADPEMTAPDKCRVI